MADVFISYSFKDKLFVQQLLSRLEQAQRDAWIDWQDIPPGSNWWEEIKDGIESAYSFVFVMSADSITSEQCIDEVNHAFSCNKQIIPILRTDITDAKKSLPQILLEINWVMFRETDDFETAFGVLCQTLDADVSYVREHTHLLVRAMEWQKRGLHDDFLLRGVPLDEAVHWLTSSVGHQPEPTPLHHEYIMAGQRAAATIGQRLNKSVRNLPNLIGLGKKKLFLSYRRADSQNITDRIYDRLTRHFNRNEIFMDIANIDLGVSFAEVIRRNLSECAAAMIVMGPQWIAMNDPSTGIRRLDEDSDFVRLEVEIALSNPSIRVMPLLVGGANMPLIQELPLSIRRLVQQNGTVIRPGRDFHKDMDDVVKQLRKARRNAR